jgi:GntR family transcriptional regulator
MRDGEHDARRDRPDEDRLPAPAAPGAAPRLVEERRQRRPRHVVHEASITSTIRPVNRSAGGSVRLTDRVAAEIRRAIADGEARPGERLPPARDLAAELGVNRNTVLSALRALRDEGLVDFRRGRGVTVAGSPERGEVRARARELVRFARSRGYGPEDLAELIRDLR